MTARRRRLMCCHRSLLCALDTLAHHALRKRAPRWLCDRHDKRILGD